MRITVDGGKCCGYGNCVLIAPKLFDLRSSDNLAYALNETPGEDERADLEQAIAECPTEAISVVQ